MTRSVSSAFFSELQKDVVRICELIELNTQTQSFRWTTSNQSVPSSLQTYVPFPGGTGGGIEEGVDLGISALDFVLANSGGVFDELLDANNLDFADIVVRRVFVHTPDMGSMEVYRGRLGDYSYTRREISGQARDEFNGANIQWPYYTYMDQCAWRFGGTGCAFDTSSITISDVLQSSDADLLAVQVASASFTNSGYAANFFDRGRVTFTSGLNSGHLRTVRTQSGDVIELSHQIPFAVSSGDTFDIFRGCRKRLVQDCQSAFNNTSNYLGFPWIPRQENVF